MFAGTFCLFVLLFVSIEIVTVFFYWQSNAEPEEERDMYEELLTHTELQGNINQINCKFTVRLIFAIIYATSSPEWAPEMQSRKRYPRELRCFARSWSQNFGTGKRRSRAKIKRESESYGFCFWLYNLIAKSELRLRSKVLQGVRSWNQSFGVWNIENRS